MFLQQVNPLQMIIESSSPLDAMDVWLLRIAKNISDVFKEEVETIWHIQSFREPIW